MMPPPLRSSRRLFAKKEKFSKLISQWTSSGTRSARSHSTGGAHNTSTDSPRLHSKSASQTPVNSSRSIIHSTNGSQNPQNVARTSPRTRSTNGSPSGGQNSSRASHRTRSTSGAQNTSTGLHRTRSTSNDHNKSTLSPHAHSKSASQTPVNVSRALSGSHSTNGSQKPQNVAATSPRTLAKIGSGKSPKDSASPRRPSISGFQNTQNSPKSSSQTYSEEKPDASTKSLKVYSTRASKKSPDVSTKPAEAFLPSIRKTIVMKETSTGKPQSTHKMKIIIQRCENNSWGQNIGINSSDMPSISTSEHNYSQGLKERKEAELARRAFEDHDASQWTLPKRQREQSWKLCLAPPVYSKKKVVSEIPKVTQTGQAVKLFVFQTGRGSSKIISQMDQEGCREATDVGKNTHSQSSDLKSFLKGQNPETTSVLDSETRGNKNKLVDKGGIVLTSSPDSQWTRPNADPNGTQYAGTAAKQSDSARDEAEALRSEPVKIRRLNWQEKGDPRQCWVCGVSLATWETFSIHLEKHDLGLEAKLVRIFEDGCREEVSFRDWFHMKKREFSLSSGERSPIIENEPVEGGAKEQEPGPQGPANPGSLCGTEVAPNDLNNTGPGISDAGSHLTTGDSNKSSDNSESNAVIITNSAKVAEEFFECGSCKKRYEDCLKFYNHHKHNHGKYSNRKKNRKVSTDLQCEQCGKMFGRVVDLTNHKRYHSYVRKEASVAEPVGECKVESEKSDRYSVALRDTTNNLWFQCRSCPLIMKYRSMMFRHYKANHLESKPFPYKVCLRNSMTMTAAHKETVDLVSQESEKSYDNGVETPVTEKSNNSDAMPAYLPVKGCAIVAKNNPSKATSICQYCGFQSSTEGIRSHLRQHHSKYVYVCSICNRSFGILATLRLHYWRHFDKNGVQKQKKWREGFSYKKHPAAFECGNCGRKFHRRCDLQHHKDRGKTCNDKHKTLRSAIFDPEFKDGLFMCSKCDYKGKQRHHLINHFARKHIEKKHQCETCGKAFGLKKDLEIHLQCHAEVKAFECNICDKGFTTSRYLKVHLLRHAAEKRHFCPNCGKGFFEKIRMKEHLETHKKPAERSWPYHCIYCDKGFISKRSLQDHENIHTGRFPYECDQCDQKFKMRSVWKHHLLYHEGKLNHVCPEVGCNKAFRFRSNLTAHQVVHTGKSKHTCALCKKVYTTFQTLQRHRCKGLQEEPAPVIETAPIESPVIVETEVTQATAEQDLFMCNECKVVVQGWEAIEEHMLTHVQTDLNVNPVEEIMESQSVSQLEGTGELGSSDFSMLAEDGVTMYLTDTESIGMVIGMSEEVPIETVQSGEADFNDGESTGMLEVELTTEPDQDCNEQLFQIVNDAENKTEIAPPVMTYLSQTIESDVSQTDVTYLPQPIMSDVSQACQHDIPSLN